MSTEIRKGDLVIVVRHPCCGAFLGRIFVAQSGPLLPESFRLPTETFCTHCKKATANTGLKIKRTEDSFYPVSWLKKIDPAALALDGDTPAQRELTP